MKPIRTFRVRQEGTKVLLAINEDTFLELQWQKADEITRALTVIARRAEEQDKAERIAADMGLLLRAGVPVGLSDHPQIQSEAAKIAAWDSVLRRQLPCGVKSEEMFGTPAILTHKPSITH